MINLPENFKNKIFGFMNQSLSVSEFETWLYDNKCLEDYLAEDEYLELTSFSYKQDESYRLFKNRFLYSEELKSEFLIWTLNKLPVSQINFRISPTEYGDNETHPQVEILINEINLLNIVNEFESKHKFKPAGSYLGPIFHPSVKEEFLGSPDYFIGENEDKCSILECSCGVSGCWTLGAKIDVLENDVFWSCFENMHRNEPDENFWDYENFSFRFDKKQYIEAVENLISQEITEKIQLIENTKKKKYWWKFWG